MASFFRRQRTLTQFNGVGLVWFGLVLGISFIEAMLKFRVPGVPRTAAFSLGQHSFDFLNKIEIVLTVWLVALVILCRSQPATRLTKILVGIVLVIIAMQSAWLQPLLIERIDMIVKGVTPPASSMHAVYVVIEAAKALTLLALGLFAQQTRPGGRSG